MQSGTASDTSLSGISKSVAPVFVVGCPRSGTTLLYHMLLSAGNFAVFRAESDVYSVLAPAFGSLKSAGNRRRLMDRWLQSRLFAVSGLDREKIRSKVISDCRTPGDFLRIQMDDMAAQQGMQRWADSTPDHILYMREIEREIPGSLFVHIIRDGRDVALSYAQLGWTRPLPWDGGREVEVAGLYWRWIVSRGREAGRTMGERYCELSFEDLQLHPQETLARLGKFIGQELDYEQICRAGVGSVETPNTSFEREVGSGKFNPVGRWRKKLHGKQLADFEYLVGDCLLACGYKLESETRSVLRNLRSPAMRTTYPLTFDLKHWLKSKTPLGRRVDLSRIESA